MKCFFYRIKIVTKEQKIYYTLRFAAVMCFIGHGAFGIITKPIWCNYFAVFGIGKDTAYQLMPVIGILDILAGLIILIYPLRIVILWLVIWGLFTATLRPLSGEPFAELIERAGNFGAPLALLLLTEPVKRLPIWLQKIKVPAQLPDKHLKKMELCLRVTAFLLLAGHGWLNLIGKKALLIQYASLGFRQTQQAAFTAGLFEVASALLILIRPPRSLLILFLFWKIGTELFYPHYEIFEWIERGGSYGTLLALWFTLQPDPAINQDTKQQFVKPFTA